MPEPAPHDLGFETYDPLAAAAIARELGLPPPVATVLARRGIETADEARAFLDAGATHDPRALGDMDAAIRLIQETAAAGGLITVHGDYDADGVCATAILVGALRSLGAECDWFIPDRLADGYGLDDSLPGRLAERGTGLLVTVDCGIVSAPVIAALRRAGIGAIVTDHHRPGPELPECPVLHPGLGYPFAGLCGAGVAAKLAQALTGEPRDLDLAAIATVADAVPLVDENRRIVREGLRRLRSAPRPGLRALMAVSQLEPERVGAREISFRLAPRINAAGRLYRADAGVELLLTESAERAGEIAAELDRANAERRAIESDVVAQAKRQAAGLAPAAGMVLAGEGWHPGVVGIAASRLVDAYGVPVLLVGIGADGTGTGSGRSVPGIDLLAALGECARLLRRFGGHAAAAGLEVDADRIDELRERFAAAVAAQAGSGPVTADPLDGVLAVSELNLDLAQGLDALAPFGQGNPEPRFLVAGAVAEAVEPMGGEGRHARLTLRTGGHRAAAVAFGAGEQASRWAGAKLDAVVRLEVNEWNGSVSARAVIDSALPALTHLDRPCCASAAERPAEYLELVARHLNEPERPEGTPIRALAGRSPLIRSERPAVGAVADLLTSGRNVAIVTADARRRAGLAGEIERFSQAPLVICSRCAGPLPTRPGGTLVTDWGALAGSRQGLEADLVAAIDPPPGQATLARIDPGADLFALWGPAEAEFALSCFRSEWDTRGHAAAIYRSLRELAEGAGPAELAVAIAGAGRHSLTPAAAARALRVLAEVGLVECARPAASGGALEVRVVSSVRTDLDRSAAYRRYLEDHRAGETFLSQQQRHAA